jgi:beta-galactosidase
MLKLNSHLPLRILIMLATTSSMAASAPRETINFDSDWKFFRGDQSGAEAVAFDDSSWRTLEVPHDWSIEDLPPKPDAPPELEMVTGEWRFSKGDDPDWKKRDLNDTAWQRVKLPDIWENHGQSTGDNVHGWFRRRIAIPAECKGRDFTLLLGRIDDVDEVWLNGERIGGTGSFPPDYRGAYSEERRYRVAASLVRGDGTDVLAVRVFDGTNKGGMVSAGIHGGRIGPFDPAEYNLTGYTVGGIGWYRKHFTLDAVGKRAAVRFDGIYMNAELWINGHRLGEHPHGYTSFEFDLTPHLKPPGEENVLAVRVRNEGKNSRWYSGSGIYRHVWLTVREPVHVPTWGVFVTTPEVSGNKALVKVSTEVRNSGDGDAEMLVRASIRDSEGKSVGSVQSKLAIPSGGTRSVVQAVVVASPKLWSPDSPNLHAVDVEIVAAGKVLDSVSTKFGIRNIEVDAKNGFRLNGKPLLLKGGCIHHDNGPLGAAALDRAEERKVELLKANGYNAIRTSHNPPSPALLDACDRLGMLVIVEAFDQWNEQKYDHHQDYSRFFKGWSERDIASMVRRDRNHPSVIMWSIGNEIPEQFRDTLGTAKRLREAVLSHDSTRLITQGICNTDPNVSKDWDNLSDPAFTYLDIASYNYLPHFYESEHRSHPDRVILGTESYPREAFDHWSLVEKHPYVIGDFVWTAMDYLGEAGLAHSLTNDQPNPFFMSWPWVNAWCGDLDICGFKKPQSFYRDVVWRRSKIEMAVHAPVPTGLTEVLSGWAWPDESQNWNWRGYEGTPLQVSVYSRCEKVRLELNGKVVGEMPVSDATKLTAKFDVPYAPGELRALGLIGGNVVAQTVIKTTGNAKKLRLTADRSAIRADRNDLSYVAVEVVDANGRTVPDARVKVRFAVSGAGELAGQASAVPNEPASFQQPERKTWQGRCLAILRPKGKAGEITLRAEADGLEPAALTIQTR